MSSRDRLVVVLALATGATDATAFERLGNAFASVITGNLVLLGVGAARGVERVTLYAGSALAGYAVGVLAAAPRSAEREDDGDWPRATSASLLGVLGLLALVTVGWELSGGQPGKAMQAVLLALAAAAMGVQSAAIRRLGSMSTTYLTSTFIGVLEAIAARRWSGAERRSTAILLVALVGAAAATLLIRYAARLLPALLLGPIVIVILASRARSG